MLRTSWLLLAAFCLPGFCQAAPETLWEQHSGPYLTRYMLWAPHDITEANVREYYRNIRSEIGDERAWTVRIFADRDDANRDLYGKLRTEEDYEWWKQLYDRYGRTLAPAAELVGRKGRVSMRIRFATGHCKEVTLEGTSLLHFGDGDYSYELLRVAFRPLPPGQTPVETAGAEITVWIRARRLPNSDRAQLFRARLVDLFGSSRLTVVFRSDAWFLLDGGFPIVYRFDEKPVPPTKEQFQAGPTRYCMPEACYWLGAR